MSESTRPPRARRTARAATAPTPPERGLAAELMRRIGECEGDPNFMTSLARGLAVLSAFGQHSRDVSMAQLSADTGIPRAAVRRVLYTLEKLGYTGTHGRGYVLLPRALGIGSGYLSTAALSVAAQPVLDALRDTLHESCSLGVLDGDDLLYVARAETVRIMSIGLRAGSRLPAYCTSMGRVLLAAQPGDTLNSYLERNPLRPRTERTVTDRAQFQALLERVQRDGYAVVDQELEIGLRSVAVPVRNRQDRVVAALNVGSSVARMTLGSLQSTVLPALRHAAQQLSRVLD
ncbi:Pca regulon regulatory protein [Xanthomonas sacchari]|uniref:IclR family transcriptional regulator domain-containing protein n=1 Tax=Xanthomonas sacchari TaxID=56458 RepID=UPI0022542131|nr:IclR family transcriptional regulator C-terminal domain-containing protein [Xanthomonas sacchari]MCW0396506.1 Pca regulon regulatory protein [Xanthomonas sacchari]MCW0446435.1 Pca regulon regulatory protein [Xanthomonas sacchari]